MKRRIFYLIALLLFTAALGIRIFQIFFRMDMTTGMLIAGETLMDVFHLLLVLFIVWLFVVTLTRRAEKMLVYTLFEADMPPSTPRQVLAYLTGGAYLLLAVSQLSALLSVSGGPIPVSAFLTAILAGLSAVFFFFLGVRERGKGEKLPVTLFATAPILLYTVRLVILYISYASIADISSYIPQMLALIFTILFWLYFAYCCGGVGSRKKLIRYGILCVGLTLIHTLSSLLIHLLAAEQPLTFPFLAWLGADLCVCAYVLCFLLTRVPNMVPALSAQHADAAKAGESE